MAKIIYAYSRRVPFGPAEEARLRAICRRLEPDNLSRPGSHQVAVRGQLAFGIANVNGRGAVVRGGNVLLGCLYGEDQAWERPQKDYPDGSFAILRTLGQRVEAVSDAAASRTLWYYCDDERFVASTSQRAIVMFLGQFDFDERVIPWMLSAGSLGPALSWDRRIRRLPPESSVVLDTERWSIALRTRPIVFAPSDRPRSEHKALLAGEIRAVMRSLVRSPQFSFEHYLLPLSGGYDSRAILCLLAEHGVPANLKAITWGLEESLQRRGNDAAIAAELARKIGVRHRYFRTDVSAEPVEKIIERFVRCAEGRTDHLAAYMDGLETWRRLLEEEGCSGIIRGDEGFGWVPVSSEAGVRINAGIGLCADFRNLEDLVERFGFSAQELPPALARQKGETLEAWRDRLYHAYRLPTVLAALSDIKQSYVEVINPLLARGILHRVRELPDRLRTGKALFKQIVDSIGPDVPYASEGANASPDRLLARSDIAALLRAEIGSQQARCTFDERFIAHVLRGLRDRPASAGASRSKGWGKRLKGLMPRSLRTRLRELVSKPVLDPGVLAFRVFLVLKMRRLLESDAAAMAAEQDQALAGSSTRGRKHAASFLS